jgi:D-threonine aldolase
MDGSNEWYKVANPEEVDSPALLVYVDRVKHNIRAVISAMDDINRLRPHIKTHKSPQVCQLMLEAGIKKFKCATIAEAEMLATAGATDILFAYQPVGPKILRLTELSDEYNQVLFSCLVDNIESASYLSTEFLKIGKVIPVYIDLNVGMNRTGIIPAQALALFQQLQPMRGIRVAGLHVYDGHIRDADYQQRKKKCDEAFSEVITLQKQIESSGVKLTLVAGGTPTFSIHNKRKNIECSPGTFVYWDKGYEQILTEQQYQFAGLVMTRVISRPAEKTICIDLGHKAIASENPLDQRVYFLNGSDLQPVGHSEEHMILKCEKEYKVGDVLYGIPHHICPTVALHDQVSVVEKQHVTDHWSNISRNRKITI